MTPSPEKAATPFWAFAAVVPKRPAPAVPELGVITTVTILDDEVTVLPNESTIATTGWLSSGTSAVP